MEPYPLINSDYGSQLPTQLPVPSSSSNSSNSTGMNILGSLSGIVGSGINYLSQKSTNEANLRLAKMQNDWNEMMWHKNNAYNTPTAQVARLRDAGINPLGQNFTSYQSSPMQSAYLANQQAPQVDSSSLVNGVNSDRQYGLDKSMNVAQIAKISEETKNTRIKNMADQIIANNLQRSLDDQHNESVAKKNLDIALGNKAVSEKKYLDVMSEWFPKEKQGLLDKWKSEEKLFDKQLERLEKLLPYEVKKLKSEANLNNATADLRRQEIKESKERIRLSGQQRRKLFFEVLNIQANTKLTNAKAKIAAINALLSEKYGVDVTLNSINLGAVLFAEGFDGLLNGINQADGVDGSTGAARVRHGKTKTIKTVGEAIYDWFVNTAANRQTSPAISPTHPSQGAYGALGAGMSHSNPFNK